MRNASPAPRVKPVPGEVIERSIHVFRGQKVMLDADLARLYGVTIKAFTQGRRTVRLPAYDYSSDGAYFITICAQNRMCLFGDVIDGEMALNQYGKIVEQELLRTPEIRKEVSLDVWMIMPNHIHAIVIINGSGDVGAHGHAPLRGCADENGAHGRAPRRGCADDNGAHGRAPLRGCADENGAHGHAPLRNQRLYRKPKSLASLIAGFKSAVTTRINGMRDTPGQPVWQRNYWEHIIRNDNTHETIRRYVLENPRHWASDEENPSRM